MKKFFFAVLLALGFGASAQAQVKLGHLNSSEILKALPGYKLAEDSLMMYQESIKSDYNSMANQLDKEMAEYDKLASDAGTPKTTLAIKKSNIENLQARLQDFQSLAQEDMQLREKELLKPLIDKLNKAIEEVAKEGGYTYIFDASYGMLLYSKESEDISDKVKKKLNITTPAAGTKPAGSTPQTPAKPAGTTPAKK